MTVVSAPASTEPPEFIAPLEETVTSILQFLRGWLSDAVATEVCLSRLARADVPGHQHVQSVVGGQQRDSCL